jgi:predicted RND superfamily exporter protein
MTQVLCYIRLYVYTLFGHRLYGWREMAMTVLTSVSIFSVTVSLCVCTRLDLFYRSVSQALTAIVEMFFKKYKREKNPSSCDEPFQDDWAT